MTASLFFLILKIDVGDAILTANTFQNDIQVVNEISKLKIEISFFQAIQIIQLYLVSFTYRTFIQLSQRSNIKKTK